MSQFKRHIVFTGSHGSMATGISKSWWGICLVPLHRHPTRNKTLRVIHYLKDIWFVLDE
jgi:hypothetical protein